MGAPKVYRPTVTKKFLECPANWYLEYVLGWVPRKIEKRDLAAWAGIAFHAAAHSWRVAGITADAAASLAYQGLEKTILQHEADGFAYGSDLADTAGRLPAMVHEGFLRFAASDPVPTDWKLVASDLPIPERTCTLDEVWETPGGVVFNDYKTKLFQDSRYLQSNLEEYDNTWQFMHYVWALSHHLKVRPLKIQYYVTLVIFAPKFQIIFQPYVVDVELLQLWEQSARSVWMVMQSIEGDSEPLYEHSRIDTLYPWHPFVWRGRFGRDPYADAFLEARLHDHLLEKDYIRKERK